MFKFIFSFLFSLFPALLVSQSLTGTNGLFKTPTAYILEDGSAYIGASLYPKGYYSLYGTSDSFSGMPTFVTLSLFDRVEFMFRYTHQLKQKVNPMTQYFPDRMFTLRYNLLQENMKLPSLTLGLHDVSEALGGTTATPYFLSTYFVASKTFQSPSFSLISTVGYGFDLFNNSRSLVFEGIFGGVEFTPSRFYYATFVIEYDSDMFNAAIKTNLLRHLQLAIGLLDMKAISGFLTYSFNLSN
jgi:hypothetical protein